MRQFIPLYPVYALLFRDRGLSTGEISSLLVIWSVTGFVLEVPSGAWADVMSRRRLLALSSLLYAAGFAVWTLWPTYAGFALGFVCWGSSSALKSGTFEALLYDSLDDHARYPRLMGRANSLAIVANLTATVLATPLFAAGGYRLLGLVSVSAALAQFGVALTLPDPPSTRTRAVRGYAAMLRTGLAEAARVRTVRRAVTIAALLGGLGVYDEYFGLVAREHHVAVALIPVLTGLTVAGQAVGTALAGRTAAWRSGRLAVLLVVAGGLVAAGAVEGRVVGFVAIALGYGAAHNLMVVTEARVQDGITGPARATVTSTIGLLEEVVALAAYGATALGGHWLSVSALVVLLTVPTLPLAVLVRRWLP